MKSKLITATDTRHTFELLVLPSIIRYYDEFNDRILSIENPKDQDKWSVYVGGTKNTIDFTKINKTVRYLVKCWIVGARLKLTTCAGLKLTRCLSSVAYYTTVDKSTRLLLV